MKPNEEKPTLDNALAHYGILGMKWGVRKSRTKSGDRTSYESLRKKDVSELSNQELTAIAKRIRLEQDVRTLTKSRRQKGKEAIGKMLGDAAKELGKEGLKVAIKKGAGLAKDQYGDQVGEAIYQLAEEAFMKTKK